MRFWDSSAVVPLVVEETRSADVERTLADDPQMTVWWGSRVEWHSAMSRSAREGRAAPITLPELIGRLDRLTSGAAEVHPSQAVRSLACALLERHALRAADALQLAAALEARGDPPAALDFVCLDQRLRDAAAREGFTVLPAADSREAR